MSRPDAADQVPPARPRGVAGPMAGIAVGLAGLLAGLAVAAYLWNAEKAPGAGSSGSATVDTVPAVVTGLEAETAAWTVKPETWVVTLTWAASDDDAEHYLVRRDTVLIRDDIGGLTFTDERAAPSTRYRYEVFAVGSSGKTSRPARVVVTTPDLPLKEARVAGRWSLVLHTVSSNIGASGGTILVSFDPTCTGGPCDTRFTFKDGGNTGVLTRSGGDYSGTGTGSFLTRDCHHRAISATVTVTFHATAAGAVRREWRANHVEGTIAESIPSTFDCLSASNTWRFEGALT